MDETPPHISIMDKVLLLAPADPPDHVISHCTPDLVAPQKAPGTAAVAAAVAADSGDCIRNLDRRHTVMRTGY